MYPVDHSAEGIASSGGCVLQICVCWTTSGHQLESLGHQKSDLVLEASRLWVQVSLLAQHQLSSPTYMTLYMYMNG